MKTYASPRHHKAAQKRYHLWKQCSNFYFARVHARDSAFHSPSTDRKPRSIPSQVSVYSCHAADCVFLQLVSDPYPAILASKLFVPHLDLETLDLVLEGPDLAHEVTGFVGRDGTGDDSTGDTAGAAEGHLGGDVDVGHVLILAEEWKVEEDGESGRKLAA